MLDLLILISIFKLKDDEYIYIYYFFKYYSQIFSVILIHFSTTNNIFNFFSFESLIKILCMNDIIFSKT